MATSPTPTKRAHLAASPFASVSYWSPNHDSAIAECRALAKRFHVSPAIFI